MKKSSWLIIVILLFLFACTTRKKVTKDTIRDGSSFERAIVINETHERPGVDDEYAWIKSNYPGYRTNSQALAYHDKKPFDIIHITTSDGKQLSVYFDISKFYGKW